MINETVLCNHKFNIALQHQTFILVWLCDVITLRRAPVSAVQHKVRALKFLGLNTKH